MVLDGWTKRTNSFFWCKKKHLQVARARYALCPVIVQMDPEQIKHRLKREKFLRKAMFSKGVVGVRSNKEILMLAKEAQVPPVPCPPPPCKDPGGPKEARGRRKAEREDQVDTTGLPSSLAGPNLPRVEPAMEVPTLEKAEAQVPPVHHQCRCNPCYCNPCHCNDPEAERKARVRRNAEREANNLVDPQMNAVDVAHELALAEGWVNE